MALGDRLWAIAAAVGEVSVQSGEAVVEVFECPEADGAQGGSAVERAGPRESVSGWSMR